MSVLFFQDILQKLIPYAADSEIFILGATGEVSYVELVNPQEAPVENTVLQVCLHLFFCCNEYFIFINNYNYLIEHKFKRKGKMIVY